MLKKAGFLLTQPWRVEMHLVPSKAVVSEEAVRAWFGVGSL